MATAAQIGPALSEEVDLREGSSSRAERRDCSRSPRASRSHSVMPSMFITSRLTFGRSGVTG